MSRATGLQYRSVFVQRQKIQCIRLSQRHRRASLSPLHSGLQSYKPSETWVTVAGEMPATPILIEDGLVAKLLVQLFHSLILTCLDSSGGFLCFAHLEGCVTEYANIRARADTKGHHAKQARRPSYPSRISTRESSSRDCAPLSPNYEIRHDWSDSPRYRFVRKLE